MRSSGRGTRLAASAAAGLSVVAAVAVHTAPADAAGGKPSAPDPAGAVQPSLVSLTGYHIEGPSSFPTVPAHTQMVDTSTCPDGQATGGGGEAFGSTIYVNLNGTFPLGGGSWRIYVNNASKVDTQYDVAAICVSTIPGYQVITTSVDNPAHTQVQVSAACPTGKVVYGGGGVSSSTATTVNLNSSLPTGATGWRVDNNNNSPSGTTVTAYAICGLRPTGYRVVKGPTVEVGAAHQAQSNAICPESTVVLSGGSYSDSSSVKVNLNSSRYGAYDYWRAFEDNASTGVTHLTTYAVCASAQN